MTKQLKQTTILSPNIEIMAPVGSYESLMAAINAGANSVYFGIEKLNMRSRSSVNFSFEDLKNIITIATENNVKTYLTVNTVIYDSDIEYMHNIVDVAAENKISAIIASDIATINYAKEMGVEVHISTQVNVANTEAVKYYSQFADVVVLARELNLKQVKQISQNIVNQQIKGPSGKLIQIEMFVHGALCMAISGKCYLSLHENNKSANRGSCLQTCRKPYTVTEKESGNQLTIDNEYIMSPKDLSTISFVDQLMNAGVSVFKIEGRARPAEYVKTVVSCYKEAIEAVNDNNYTVEKIQAWENRLKSVFNRGFWGGYYLGRKLGEWSEIYGSRATKYKMYVGKVSNYFSKINIAEIKIEAGEIKINSEVLITGPTTGVVEFKISEIRKNKENTQQAIKSDIVSLPVPNRVRRGDKLYMILTKKLEY